jgi:tetrahydromethanopterin S-methyltransferase subunit G
MTYATIVHRLDIVRHKLGERKYGEKKERDIGRFFGLVLFIMRIVSVIELG